MSGIYICGMEMPKEGNETILRLMPDGTVLDQYGHHLALKAVPVPPHGRLIDAETLIDAIIAKYIRHERHRELVFAVVQIKQDMADIINELPTIIPASGGKENE